MTKVVAPFKLTKWLLLSSTSFIIPSIYGFYKHTYGYAVLSTTILICSLNFWRDAKYGMRRNIDVCVAHSGALIYTINALHILYKLHIKTNSNISFIPYFTYGLYPIFCTIFGMHIIAENRYTIFPNTHYWVKYHMIFHVFCALGQSLTIYSSVL